VVDTNRSSSLQAARGHLTNIAPLVPLIMVGAFASRSIGDNSFLWHVRAGSVQWESGLVLTEDVFSFTRLGEAWRTQSWLAELGYAGAEEVLGGLVWVNWMLFLVGSAIVGLLALTVYQSMRSSVVIGFVLVVAVFLLGPFLQPRPVILSYLLLALLVLAVQHRHGLTWVIVPTVWVWAAIHGSWILGIGFVALEAMRTRDRRLFAASGLALVSTLVTAHGFGTWMIVLEFLESREALSMLQEWRPPAPQDLIHLPYLLLVFAVVVGGLRERIEVRDLIVILPFLLFGLTAKRSVFPAAIVLLPWAVMCLHTPAPRVATVPRRLVTVAGAVIVAVALLPMLANPLGVLDESRFPSRRIVGSLSGDRWFHSMMTGGYLIYADWPAQLVYIDDRAELYGVDAFIEYRDLIVGRDIEPLRTLGITGVIAEREWPLVEVLILDGWITSDFDENFIALSRP
jgi:hypothetical protein